MSAKASGSDPKGNGAAHQRQHHDGSSTRAYTDEQKAAVVRVRRCSPTAFYDILGLEAEKTTITDGGIKKAYRKLSLLTHPDKNGYTGADEAFKMVSRAFQILSDPDKRKKFDTFGGDPDSRFGAGSAASSSAAQNPFAGFARAAGGGGPRAGPMFEEEISPEELFRQFFGGGGMGGGPFGGGGLFNDSPAFVFNMGGGPGIRVHQFGGGRPRRRPAGAPAEPQQPTAFQALQTLLPLVLLFVIPLLSSIFSGTTSSPRVPLFSPDSPRPPLTEQHATLRHKIPYFVNPRDVADLPPRKWRELSQAVENDVLYRLDTQCDNEGRMQRRMLEDSQGWFSVDQDKYEAAVNLAKPACSRLRGMGFQR